MKGTDNKKAMENRLILRYKEIRDKSLNVNCDWVCRIFYGTLIIIEQVINTGTKLTHAEQLASPHFVGL